MFKAQKRSEDICKIVYVTSVLHVILRYKNTFCVQKKN